MVAERVKRFPVKATDFLILFLFPWLLILLNSNWIFSPANGMPDTWFYYAFFRYFFQYASEFPSNSHYFVERLTWIVPGFYVYRVFSPLWANYILHLAVYYTATFSLYGVLRILFNARTALIAALAMGSYPWFLRAAGWDYVDGVGIAHMLLLLFLLIRATRSGHWKMYLFVAGIVHASMLITNQFWAGFAPAWSVFFLLLNQREKKNQIGRLAIAVLCFLAGNLVLTGLVSLFFHAVTGNYNFLENSMQFSRMVAQSEENKNEVTQFYGTMFPYWHLLPLLFFLAAAWTLRSIKDHLYRYSFLVILAFFVLSYGWVIFWHVYAIPYLIIFLYSSYLIPAAFLLLGALLSVSLAQVSETAYTQLLVFSILIFAIPFILSTFDEWQDHPYLLVFFILIMLAGLTLLPRTWIILPTLISLSALSFLGGRNTWIYLPNRSQNQNNFLTVSDVGELIDAQYPDWNYNDFRLWYKRDKNVSTYGAIASVYLYPWGSVINMSPARRFVWPRTTRISDGNIVLLSANHDVQQVLIEAARAFPAKNARMEYVDSSVVQHGDISVTVIFASVEGSTSIPLEYGEKYEFESVQGVNWYSTEIGSDNQETFAWSGPGSTSEIEFLLPAREDDATVEFCVLGAILPELPQTLQLSVNGISVPVDLSRKPNCPYFYRGVIPSDVLRSNPSETLFSFEIDRTVSPKEMGVNADSRKLGLGFDWIEIK
jgi:hypothetical protein